MRQRSVAWAKDDGAGAEFAEVALDAEVLSARGVSIGGGPVAYRLDYVLETGPGFVTTRLEVTARGEGWRRTLDLRRAGSGDWTASVTTEGDAPESLDAPGAGLDAAGDGPGGPPERPERPGRQPPQGPERPQGPGRQPPQGPERPQGPGGRAPRRSGEPGGLRRLGRVAGALDCDLGLSPLTNSMPVLRHRLLAEEGSVDFLMAWVSVPDLGVHPSRQRYTALGDLPGGSRIRFESLDSGFSADLSFDRDGLVVDYPGIGRRLG